MTGSWLAKEILPINVSACSSGIPISCNQLATSSGVESSFSVPVSAITVITFNVRLLVLFKFSAAFNQPARACVTVGARTLYYLYSVGARPESIIGGAQLFIDVPGLLSALQFIVDYGR